MLTTSSGLRIPNWSFWTRHSRAEEKLNWDGMMRSCRYRAVACLLRNLFGAHETSLAGIFAFAPGARWLVSPSSFAAAQKIYRSIPPGPLPSSEGEPDSPFPFARLIAL